MTVALAALAAYGTVTLAAWAMLRVAGRVVVSTLLALIALPVTLGFVIRGYSENRFNPEDFPVFCRKTRANQKSKVEQDMKKLALLAVLLLVAACGGGRTPPRNLDDACAIYNDHPRWMRSMHRVERRWGVPAHVQMATIYQESKFVARARTPMRWALGIIPMGRRSSAYGYAQVIDSTWDWYRKDTGRRFARRDRFGDATDFIGWYMDRSNRKNGISKSDARNQYLAYHEGQAGYARGNHRGKGWLLRIADSVGDRSAMYERQLRRCR